MPTPKLARHAALTIAHGERVEDATKSPNWVKVSYVETTPTHKFVELSDGSAWKMPRTEAQCQTEAAAAVTEAYDGALGTDGQK